MEEEGESDRIKRTVSNERVEELWLAFEIALSAIERECPFKLPACVELVLSQSGLGQKVSKVELRMRSRVEKQPWLTPKRLAEEARYSGKLPTSMMPYLITMAQRVKKRLGMKRFRERLAHDRALTAQEEGGLSS